MRHQCCTAASRKVVPPRHLHRASATATRARCCVSKLLLISCLLVIALHCLCKVGRGLRNSPSGASAATNATATLVMSTVARHLHQHSWAATKCRGMCSPTPSSTSASYARHFVNALSKCAMLLFLAFSAVTKVRGVACTPVRFVCLALRTMRTGDAAEFSEE